MSADLRPPTIEISSHLTAEEQESLKSGARTPRPYLHDASSIQQDNGEVDSNSESVNGTVSPAQASDQAPRVSTPWQRQSGQSSVAASDSGTEADDERPSFVKALPAPHIRLRKGLKAGETNANVLLTPSQLDDEEGELSKTYFDGASHDKTVSEDEQKVEQEKRRQIRLAEFVRRTSEVAFTAVLICCVLCGKGVLQKAYEWRRELISHVAIISSLILVYPVKLSIVDSSSQARRVWERFRVPTSFDPATVLYPTLLPVLVALSVSPADPASILPNIILGLSSLPQRLFPRSSRLGSMNVLHWFIATVPLIVSENTAWPFKIFPALPYLLKVDSPSGVFPETLVCLYPLHHILLQPLQYMTTTSLLSSEVHLLSTGLINLLLLASSPQAVIVKACLWMGGVCLLTISTPILHWNIMLMRIPKWKLRRQPATSRKSGSLFGSVLHFLPLRKSSTARSKTDTEDSDADEDEPLTSIKQKLNGAPLLRVLSLNIPTSHTTSESGPKSAIEPREHSNGVFSGIRPTFRPRSNTLPVLEAPILSQRPSGTKRKEQSPNVLWCLDLTPAQAQFRKWMYAATVYIAMAVIILCPVRYYVLEKALYGQEPIGWALGYLFGQLDAVRSWVFALDLEDWVACPSEPVSWHHISISLPLDVPSIRAAVGAANMRLVLIAYWAPVLIIGLLVVFSLTAIVEVDTRRKVFHGVMVAMILPSTFIDPCACALALTLVLAVFLLLEVIRAGQLPPLGKAIGKFVAPYVDGRDLRGPVVVSHFFLLIGCAVPLWFSLASIPQTGELPWKGWDLQSETREVAMVAGVVCVGMGDAAASLFGRRYGRHKWIWVGGKSIEGSVAFAVAVTVGLMLAKLWLVFGGWNDNSGSLASHTGDFGTLKCILAWHASLSKAILCACGASFMEAILTGANDNVVVPIALWLLVKGVRL